MKRPAPRVYEKHGAWWYVDLARKWHRLGHLAAPEHVILAELAKVKAGGEGTANALADLLDRYEEQVLRKKAPKTRAEQDGSLKRLRIAFKAFTRPAQVKSKHVAEYLDAAPSPVMANRDMALLSHVFTKAIRWGKAEVNPCRGVERNPEGPRKRYPTHVEFWGAWELADSELRAFLELLYITGQRPSDVLKIRESEVRADGLYFKQGKTAKEIVITWSPWLRDVVQAARSLHEVRSLWLLADRQGQAFTYGAMAQRFGKIMRGEAYTGERFQLRDVRRKSGTDHETGDHLGHADKRVRDRVYRVNPEVQKGVELDSQLDSAASATASKP